MVWLEEGRGGLLLGWGGRRHGRAGRGVGRVGGVGGWRGGGSGCGGQQGPIQLLVLSRWDLRREHFKWSQFKQFVHCTL